MVSSDWSHRGAVLSHKGMGMIFFFLMTCLNVSSGITQEV